MDYKYITNIRHLISEDPASEIPDAILRERDFLGLIIKAATSGDEINFISAVPCRKRVNRKPCQGTIMIMRQDVPTEFIYWHCDSCEDGGRISEFAGTWYDLRKWEQHVSFEPGEVVVEVVVNRDEYKALISPEINTYDPDSEKIIFSAKKVENKVRIRASESEMDNFIGFVAPDSNHEPNRKRSKLLDSLFSKIQNQLDHVMTEGDLTI